MIKNILILLCLMVLQSSIHNAAAHDIIINNNTTNHYGGDGGGSVVEMRSSLEDDVSKAVATAASMAFCQFDYSPAFQACAGTATYNEQWALNFQVGKRIDTMLLTGGFACDDEFDECAAGGAVSWHF